MLQRAGRALPRPARPCPREHNESGSAVVDFVMVGALVIVVFVALLQVALGVYARNVLTDAAGDGARRAALVGGTEAEARQRVQVLTDAALRRGYVDTVTVSRVPSGDLRIVEVTVTAPFPVLGLFGPVGTLRVGMVGSRRRGSCAASWSPRAVPARALITGWAVSRLREALRAGSRSVRRLMSQEEGNAIVEFIGWSAVLVVPVLYLVVTLAQLQATTFAVASAADAASRVLEVDDSPSAMDNAQLAMQLSLSDQGIDADLSGSLSVTCAHGCARGQAAMVEVSVGVDLPGFASLGIGRDVVVVATERSITLPGKEEP